MSKNTVLKGKVRSFGKNLAYSEIGRQVARQLVNTPEENRVRKALNTHGLDNALRRVAGEHLSDGLYFAKLTIKDWRNFNGSPFRLYQNGKLVYGNQIEPPARGFPLEYRNIMVTSTDLRDFSLDIDSPYTLKIGKGAFTTPEQIKYDSQYGVKQHGDVYYSLRGNTKNPKRLLLTFPGFGPSTTRISYAVSYMKALTEQDLHETMMICFQDRYLAAGSYMMVDNSGRPLYDRVKGIIDSFVNKFGILEENMMFFGASKGGSIAISYAEDYEAAHLLLAVPQMNLPYYFNKPFFRDNLFQNSAISTLVQPQEKLLKYFQQARKIDYFYTNDDELSNRSIIEFVKDVPNLTKYRINGVHGAVARTALPSMLNIMRQFLAPMPPSSLSVTQMRQYDEESSTMVQVRVKESSRALPDDNWFLEGSLGRTKFRQIFSNGVPKFMKYLGEDQKLLHAVDDLDGFHSVTAMSANGAIATGTLPEKLNATCVVELATPADKSPIEFDADVPRTYNIIDNNNFEQFEYISSSSSKVGSTLEIRLVDDFKSDSLLNAGSDTRQIFALKINEPTELLRLFIVRAVIDCSLKKVIVSIPESLNSRILFDVQNSTEWDDIEVNIL